LDATEPAAPGCPSNLLTCADGCFDPAVDPNHCGACDVVCAPDEDCTDGACGLRCVGGTTLCGDRCADLRVDPANCGACGQACADAERCSDGACGLGCGAGTTACGSVCVALADDPANCGACDRACAADEVCANGACAASCAAPLLDCQRACVDPSSDPRHCGGCDRACPMGQVCSDGDCALVCPVGRMSCGGACVDTASDPANCGGCGTLCPPGMACFGGACAPVCGDGITHCGGACVDTRRDPLNCGGCDHPCASFTACVYGVCADQKISHILMTGQSLATGLGAFPVIETSQPFTNLMFNTGVRAGGSNLTSFVPLIEQAVGLEGETMGSSLGNSLTVGLQSIGLLPRRWLVSSDAVSGAPYSSLMKGTASYANGMAQVAAGQRLAAAAGQSFMVRAVTVIHGESDHSLFLPYGNPNYLADLVEWQHDYETDVRGVTGQSTIVPMFLCQMSSWTKLGSGQSIIPIQQLEAAEQHPDRFHLVTPKYFLPYWDGLHITSDGERWLGAYYARALQQTEFQGRPWVPLSPRSVRRAGAVITVELNVPTPPLVLDTVNVGDPGNFGFEYHDASANPPAITGVAIAGPTTVQITLASTPTVSDERLRYAYSGVPTAPAGPNTGARGNLRDSDPSVAFGHPLYNWCVTFDKPVE
jgi:hypothetical protein